MESSYKPPGLNLSSDSDARSHIQDTTPKAETKIEHAAPQALHALVRALARQAAAEVLRSATSTRTNSDVKT